MENKVTINESSVLDKVYNHYLNVDVDSLDKEKTLDKIFLGSYKGSLSSNNINRDTPSFSAWRAGKNRKEKEGEELEESLNEECGEPKVEIEITIKTPENEEKGKELVVDEFEDPNEECEECEDMFVEEKSNYMKDIDDLSKIMESIKNGMIEEKLMEKDDQLNYILSRFTSKKVEKVVLEKISDMPSYVKTADIQQTLKNLSDQEVQDLYAEVEKIK